MTMPMDRTQERRSRRGCAARAWLRLALPVIAGVAWWLAAMPATAQGQQPEARAGKAAPPSSGDPADRNQLLIVGAATMGGITEEIIRHLADSYVMPKPIIRFDGTRNGIAAFCSGIGPEYPDIVAAADRMSRGEFET